MTEPSVQRDLGRLEGKIDAIIAQQQKDADRLERLVTTPEKIESVEKRVAKLEPIADDFSKWKERGVGAMMLISFIAALLGAAITAAWQKILALFGGH